jgi:hypothetical protein
LRVVEAERAISDDFMCLRAEIRQFYPYAGVLYIAWFQGPGVGIAIGRERKYI